VIRLGCMRVDAAEVGRNNVRSRLLAILDVLESKSGEEFMRVL